MATNTVINHQNKGFTLIELMIVVVIIGIIAAIAYPSYQDSVRKARRADAQSQMMELASFMERFYTENNQYHQINDASAAAVSLPGGIDSDYYDYSLSGLSATTYTIDGARTGSQTADTCGDLAITNTGGKIPSNCW